MQKTKEGEREIGQRTWVINYIEEICYLWPEEVKAMPFLGMEELGRRKIPEILRRGNA
ncbi:predicted protein [Coccidioides posadasii str. Silveira]|uniref:Predicted protein n=1 Tax=Coccidioides posadasii (strain RMSCC 757 / Silveira) TaxID=443226 RepID=E9D9Q2_COCPS|nr:predicted protein [Coccidioides posadasii str. Silveira]